MPHGPNSRHKPRPMTADRPMTAAQQATLKTLAQAAYELDTFNSPAPRRINASRCLALSSSCLTSRHIHSETEAAGDLSRATMWRIRLCPRFPKSGHLGGKDHASKES